MVRPIDPRQIVYSLTIAIAIQALAIAYLRLVSGSDGNLAAAI